MKNIDSRLYDITVVSPRNYFTFTPLLPKISSGMVSGGTCAEPMPAYINNRFKGNAKFIHATCTDVDPESHVIYCAPVGGQGPSFSVPYDYLVVAVGTKTNSFGIPGVEEYAYFLKEMEHAETVFNKILDNFRKASMPYVTDEEKRNLLHFVVVGGGPTGVESAGEMALLFNKYAKDSFPELMPFVQVSIVEGGSKLLPSFSLKNSAYVAKHFGKSNINMIFGKTVCEVRRDACMVKDTKSDHIEEVKCGMVLWASGLKEIELVSVLRKKWKEQTNPRALLVDQYLKLYGSENIFALGDCCKVSPSRLPDNYDYIVEQIGANSVDTLIRHRKRLSLTFPQLNDSKWNYKDKEFKEFVNDVKSEYGSHSKEGFIKILDKIDTKYVPPFPTAQNAKQQGIYLAKAFNTGSISDKNKKAFCEKWLGSIASLGGLSVVAHLPLLTLNGGLIAFFMWNFVYMIMFSSNKMRLRFIFDLIMNRLCRRQLISKGPK
ncbi:conserved hypothetical protein [Theileria equi strain WA]|uniref:NADH:ubiquinone reductase (non-electrogenic) n=1 Tax=Theileria equi strain WA TaxID=1537102 RepID=L1LBU3_THEEQ|nr:conserved hypothetical protein [Theileria equi strain WA]EKX72648.1 conserved hypothetical protein [Theileria equi strain WA]|eukprot:XP_004832100.1 conserved hypothetical protein [Theileria equi strain WA]